MVGQRRAMQHVPASKDLRTDLGRLFVQAENDPSELDFCQRTERVGRSTSRGSLRGGAVRVASPRTMAHTGRLSSAAPERSYQRPWRRGQGGRKLG
jgi:hypothetical protein